MPYLYIHTRQDKNEIFYVGISESSTDYKRSKSKSDRNSIWKRIVAKTTYAINIIIESDDFDYIRQKEVELVALYGRIDKDTGILANMTDGGEGVKGLRTSSSARPVISVFNGQEFESAKKLSEFLNIPYVSVIGRLNHNTYNDTGFVYKSDFEIGLKPNDLYKKQYKDTRVIDVVTEQIFASAVEASKYNSVPLTSIWSYLNRTTKNKTNLIWYREYEKGLLVNKASEYAGLYANKPLIDIFTNEIYLTQTEASEKIGYSRNHIMCMMTGKKTNYTGLVLHEDYILLNELELDIIMKERKVLIDFKIGIKNKKDFFNDFTQEELDNEEWKDIPDYEGLYKASNIGRIKRLDKEVPQTDGLVKNLKEKILELSLNSENKFRTTLIKDGIAKEHLVSRLTISAFKGKSDKKIKHLDGVTTNNRKCNLEYVSYYVKRNSVNVKFSKSLNRWQARITLEGRRFSLGVRLTKEEAEESFIKAISDYEDFGKLPTTTRPKVSKYKGIGYSKNGGNKKWSVRYKGKHMGRYPTEEIAYEVLCKLEQEYVE